MPASRITLERYFAGVFALLISFGRMTVRDRYVGAQAFDLFLCSDFWQPHSVT